MDWDDDQNSKKEAESEGKQNQKGGPTPSALIQSKNQDSSSKGFKEFKQWTVR